MALNLINVGTYALDAKGDLARDAFIKTKGMFQELYTLSGIAAPPATVQINVGAGPNSVPPGTPSNIAFPLINQDFSTLFSRVGQPTFQEVILMGGEPGMIVGENSKVIGTGDPARTAWIKVNLNFSYLYAVI